ncbi:MAG: hypothetical protein EXX96DRAFT_588164 [Benjaminiella poitrasii]|nr:MAG: hypothetical protein EXX96DRAFT_588164 [Benjaminiella poitrasii]
MRFDIECIRVYSYPFQALKLRVKSLNYKQVVVSPIVNRVEKVDYQTVENTLKRINEAQLDFTVFKKTSSIPNAGLGVYLSGQDQRKGTIVSFYPGLIYMPYEPILLASIANQYILKCVDGVFVDGKPTGLSRRIYQSIYKRENWPGAIQISDETWLNDNTLNPLAIGQYVNNGMSSAPFEPNVCYQEVDLPVQFPNHLRRYIPNMYWNTQTDPLSNHAMRVVVLVALRDIKVGEELFSTYMDIVK